MEITKNTFESGNLAWGADGPPESTAPLMNVYSAFSPYAGRLDWSANDDDQEDPSPDKFNNWVIVLPFQNITDPDTGYEYEDRLDSTTQQLWIQTAEKSMVCTMGNATFDVEFEFVNAALTVAEYSISMFEPFLVIRNGGGVTWSSTNSYMAFYLALSSLLNGNVSTTLTNSFTPDDQGETLEFDGNVTIYDGSSRVLELGLSACDDFVHSYVSPLPPLSNTLWFPLNKVLLKVQRCVALRRLSLR